MQVALGAIHKDEFFFEVHPEIEVANPAQPHRGRVRIAGRDSFMWECHLRGTPESAGITPQDFAATIASVLTGSLSDR
jgi:hypothetical protein